MPQDREDRLAIVETVNNWALWRDAGDWERFRAVWHDDGWMTATWFQGPVVEALYLHGQTWLDGSPSAFPN